VKHIIAADINGYSWYCLAMDPWYKGICICWETEIFGFFLAPSCPV
jgi:hypothetical protein